MVALSRASILASNDMRVLHVSVPEWADNGVPAEVCLRRFSIADSNIIARRAPTAADDLAAGIDFTMRVLVLALCDETGKRLLTEDDIPALMEKDSQVLKRLVHEALVFNKLAEPDGEDPGKNSQPITNGASPSG